MQILQHIFYAIRILIHVFFKCSVSQFECLVSIIYVLHSNLNITVLTRKAACSLFVVGLNAGSPEGTFNYFRRLEDTVGLSRYWG